MWAHLYTDFPPNKYSWPLVLWVLHPQIQPTLNQKQYFQSLVGIHRGKTYCMRYSLPCKELEHLRILVCVSSAGTNPSRIVRDNLVKLCGGVRSYTQIFNCRGISAPNPCLIQRSRYTLFPLVAVLTAKVRVCCVYLKFRK